MSTNAKRVLSSTYLAKLFRHEPLNLCRNNYPTFHINLYCSNHWYVDHLSGVKYGCLGLTPYSALTCSCTMHSTHEVCWILHAAAACRSPRTTDRQSSIAPTDRASRSRRSAVTSWRAPWCTDLSGPRCLIRRRCPAVGWWRVPASRERRTRRRRQGTPGTRRETRRRRERAEPSSTLTRGGPHAVSPVRSTRAADALFDKSFSCRVGLGTMSTLTEIDLRQTTPSEHVATSLNVVQWSTDGFVPASLMCRWRRSGTNSGVGRRHNRALAAVRRPSRQRLAAPSPHKSRCECRVPTQPWLCRNKAYVRMYTSSMADRMV